MNSQICWQLFMDTGAPEAYLLYNKARKMEVIHAPDDQRSGTAGIDLS